MNIWRELNNFDNQLNTKYYDNTIEIYTFAFFMHFYVFLLDYLYSFNPMKMILYTTFLYSIFKYFFNYSLLTFFMHPIWYKRFFHVALPQLITAINNTLILKENNSMIISLAQSGIVYGLINYNFENYELSQSNNIRGVWMMITFILKYLMYLILN